MIPDSFNITVGPTEEKAPVPVAVNISVDDKLLVLGGFAILGLLTYAKIRNKRK